MNAAESPKPLNAILSEICRHCPYAADDVIDLHLGFRRACEPGRCAKAYFRLSEFAGQTVPWWGEVDRYIRSLLAVEAWGDDAQRIEVWNFEPTENETLEAYCERMMRTLQLDRAYGFRNMRMNFCYKNGHDEGSHS